MNKWMALFLGIWGTVSVSWAVSHNREYAKYDAVWTERLNTSLVTLLQDELLETSQLGICIYDLTADTMAFSYNMRQRMRPASTEKIITAVAVLSELGGAHTFSTKLYYTGEIRNRVLWGDVYAVGGFDPRFGKDDMQAFINGIQSLNIDSIAGFLYADVSMKDTLKWGYGWCWDDDMPVLSPLLYKEKDLFVQVMGDRLHEASIHYSGTGKAECPSDAELLVTRAHTLDQILWPMMKNSDNLYAEAMFYQLLLPGKQSYSSRKEVVYYIERLISSLGYDPGNYLIADGSGVSLYNYLTPELEVAFLRYAYSHRDIFIHLYPSLPIAGKDGTLRNRMKKGSACEKVHAKTGTLEGVVTLAGYATASNGHQLAFCIMNQGTVCAAMARDFQDKVCEILCK